MDADNWLDCRRHSVGSAPDAINLKMQFDGPDLAPVIACEHTANGWRGLTADGELLNVTAPINGAPAVIPESLAIEQNGITAYRAVSKPTNDGAIDAYERHLNASIRLCRANEPRRALEEIDAALGHAHTMVARYNRGMILLALGHWQEGFDEWSHCERTSPLFMRPQYRTAIEGGLVPWTGQNIAGKKLLLIHDHGFGDSLMMLRYIPRLRAMGADIVLQVPPELHRLAKQCAFVTRKPINVDYVCSLLMLMPLLHETSESIAPASYLKVDPVLVEEWRRRLCNDRKQIGVAWSIGKNHTDDYPRAAPLGLFVKMLGHDATLISMQQQGRAEANMLGVENYQFEDFADCAACMSLMDEIVTVDTAAVHLAGAIGHPRISLLLSHWSSWRWQAPLYRNLRLCRQDSAGDWESAFAKRDGAFAAA
jgi:hypothetical protein